MSPAPFFLRWFLAAVTVTGLASTEGVARAEGSPAPSEAARKHAQQLVVEGAALNDRGDHAAALGRFQAAYSEFPSPKILFNIAQMHVDLGNNADAADAFQQFLDAVAADAELAKSEFAKTAREKLAQLKPTVGQLKLTTIPDGAKVETDTRSRRPGTIYLSPGAHQLVVSQAGYVANKQIVAISAGETEPLTVTLVAVRGKVPKEIKVPRQMNTPPLTEIPVATSDESPCQKLEDACKAAGFAKGKLGKALYRDCVGPLVGGKTVEGVTISPDDLQACASHYKPGRRGRPPSDAP